MTTETNASIPHHWVLTLSGRVSGRDAAVGSHGVLPLAPAATGSASSSSKSY